MSSINRGSQQRICTPDLRHLGVSTDDSAIFIEDTIDRTTAQCISVSPSAVAFLSPQRLPNQQSHVDVTEYDPSHLGIPHTSCTKRSNSAAQNDLKQQEALVPAADAAAPDTAEEGSCAMRLSFLTSPMPCEAHGSVPCISGSINASTLSSTPGQRSSSPSARMPEPMVPLHELEHAIKERNRYEKMYEHQKALYEAMAEKHAETYRALQEKIVAVVALSTHNEESKKFIRQLKKEMSESRTRAMDIQNKVLEEARAERNAKSRYEALIEEQERRYERMAERSEDKLVGIENLVRDLVCMKLEQDRLHVSQLDTLLKAAYIKNAALSRDLMRQNRQIDLLFDGKAYLEQQGDQLRREKQMAEQALAEERRRMMYETEHFIEQIEGQQQSILNLRQMLIRTMDTAVQAESPPLNSRDLPPDHGAIFEFCDSSKRLVDDCGDARASKFCVSLTRSKAIASKTESEGGGVSSNLVGLQNSSLQLSATRLLEIPESLSVTGVVAVAAKEEIDNLFHPPSVDMAAVCMTMAENRSRPVVSSLVLNSLGSANSGDNAKPVLTPTSSSMPEASCTQQQPRISAVSHPAPDIFATKRNKQGSQRRHLLSSLMPDTAVETQRWRRRTGAESEGSEKENDVILYDAFKYRSTLKKPIVKLKSDADDACPRLASQAVLRTLLQRHNKDG